ncbi:nucleotidyltransferase family protein [Sphingomonas sp.]|uniref:nucleotidyltransferase domain-containing protein n=1 Tax=Sphingomonas sp. TaxID=28214 RepID=UPI002D80C8C6|nr:nucleotidyltransferase family protein [Sphingomonas sp.]HEU0044459.1 nucleotidyltransferase family protein [Sphingomonas sp.]
MRGALSLVRALAGPGSIAALDGASWTGMLTVARAEQLLGTLAHRLDGLPVPDSVAGILADAKRWAEHERRTALWEAEMARRALAPLQVSVVLLKGTAYAAAGLMAGQGRSIGDLDLLVPRDRLDAAEAALLANGWEWVKPDPYDDAYYRRWMHELPPLIHRERDRMADVHHTILPLTAQAKPDPAVLIANAVELGGGLSALSPEHMVVHAAAHLFADGDLAGGLRNLWDIDRLCREFADRQEDFYLSVVEEAFFLQLGPAVLRALRLTQALYGTPVPPYTSPLLIDPRWSRADRLFLRRLLARDDWGRAARPVTRAIFYARSHWLRMPPAMLARHLWTKWRRRDGA